MDSFTPLFGNDWKEDVFIVLTGVFIGLVFVSSFTGLDSQARFALQDFRAFTSESNESVDLVFSEDDVGFMNRHSRYSLGLNSFAAERLYCFTVSDKQVTGFRSADVIESSTGTSVSGSCESPVDGFVHTQPGFSGGLSEEDKSLESDINYMCIQYDEIVESPVSGGVYGLNCWEVSGNRDNPVFERVNVGIGR